MKNMAHLLIKSTPGRITLTKAPFDTKLKTREDTLVTYDHAADISSFTFVHTVASLLAPVFIDSLAKFVPAVTVSLTRSAAPLDNLVAVSMVTCWLYTNPDVPWDNRLYSICFALFAIAPKVLVNVAVVVLLTAMKKSVASDRPVHQRTYYKFDQNRFITKKIYALKKYHIFYNLSYDITKNKQSQTVKSRRLSTKAAERKIMEFSSNSKFDYKIIFGHFVHLGLL